jgi:hypothetical protein
MEDLRGEISLPEESPAHGGGRAPSWREVVDAYGEAREWGEARIDEALERIPSDAHLRIVLMVDRDGPVLRWLVDGSSEAKEALGGYFHEDLIRGEFEAVAVAGTAVVRKSRLPRGRREIELWWYRDEASSTR